MTATDSTAVSPGVTVSLVVFELVGGRVCRRRGMKPPPRLRTGAGAAAPNRASSARLGVAAGPGFLERGPRPFGRALVRPVADDQPDQRFDPEKHELDHELTGRGHRRSDAPPLRLGIFAFRSVRTTVLQHLT